MTNRGTRNSKPGKMLSDVLALIGTRPANTPGGLQLKTGDKISFMGDSITQQGGYIRLVAYILKTSANLKFPPFTNAGIGGQKAEDMAPRFAKDMKLAGKPAWVFINVGVNDVAHRLGRPHKADVLAAYRTNVAKMVETGQASGARTVLLTPTVIQEDVQSEGNRRLTGYVDAMKRIAAEKRCLPVNLHDLFLKAIARRKTAARKLTCDGFHMTAYGDAIMAIGVLRAMGIPDAVIAAVDVTPILQVRGWGMDITAASKLLGIPATRFAKPELTALLVF